ncbi:hypothetical protein BDZ94DRAFT_1237065 [Collybia nuda]|uniref:BTB domain-containing protein n=1 Tax=Collybia nuda TaxID=64659 RepID=A0A9P5Y2S3_9AGAR|nr:hypothetical protein BDZ94DRAFT_1237065 [Collybia nuda]
MAGSSRTPQGASEASSPPPETSIENIGVVRFRLHQSRLMSQSPWFEALFKKHTKTTSTTGSVVGGCDVEEEDYNGDDEDEDDEEEDDSADIDDVTVESSEGQDIFILDSTGITIEDFLALLVAIDNAITYYHNDPGFQTVACIFRAVSTLNFPAMIEFAKLYVENEFPDDVESVSRDRLDHAAEAVTQGCDCNTPLILKRAFYKLAQKEEEEDDGYGMAWNGKHGNDEDSAEEDENEDGRDEFTRLMAAWISVLDMEPLGACASTCKASSAPAELFRSTGPPGGVHLIHQYQFDPIYGIQKLIEVDWVKWGYCAGCAKRRKNDLKGGG